MKEETTPKTAAANVGLRDLLTQPAEAQEDAPTPLFRVTQIDAGEAPARELAPLQQTTRWLREFLAQPHPDLGRTGPVCPFVPMSLELDTLYLTCVHTEDVSKSDEIAGIVGRFRDVFLSLEPREGDDAINKSLLMIFPDVPLERAEEMIDAVQKRLKPEFTRFGLMLGEFHELNRTPGLRNPEFYPLRSPLCMLVIRHMVESDLPFLGRPEDPAAVRVGFLRAYLRRLGGKASERKLNLAIDTLVDAEIERRRLEEQQKAGSGGGRCPVAH